MTGITSVYTQYHCRWHGAWLMRGLPAEHTGYHCPFCTKHNIIQKVWYWLRSIDGIRLVHKSWWDNPPIGSAQELKP